MERKTTELSRYESMYNDLMNMHKQGIDVMETRGTTLRSRLQQEKNHLIEEEKKLSGNEYSLKNDKEQLDLTVT